MKENTIEALKKAGWYPGRKIDINELVAYYEKNRFEMFPAAKKFLEEYGLLDITIPINPKISEEDILKYNFKRSRFNTTNMMKSIVEGTITRDYVIEYEDSTGEKLFLVGKLYDGHQYLMISESGKLFTENGFYGNNAEEFWDRLFSYDTVTNWEAWTE